MKEKHRLGSLSARQRASRLEETQGQHGTGPPPGSKGWISAIWVQGVVPCGFVAVSCYLHTVEGATGRNVQLLAKAFEGINGSRCPLILGLAAQQEPRDFLAWPAPMVERAGARGAHTGTREGASQGH